MPRRSEEETNPRDESAFTNPTGAFSFQRRQLRETLDTLGNLGGAEDDRHYYPIRFMLTQAWKSGGTLHDWLENEREAGRNPIHEAIQEMDEGWTPQEEENLGPAPLQYAEWAIMRMRQLDRLGAGKVGGRHVGVQGSLGELEPYKAPPQHSPEEIREQQKELTERGAVARQAREQGTEPPPIDFENPSLPVRDEGEEYMRHGWFRDQHDEDLGEIKRKPAPKARKAVKKRPAKKRPAKKRY